jgi:2'-5' RNA ligase
VTAHEHPVAAGGAAPPARRLRLFVAVWPPPAVVGVLAGLDHPAVEGVRWTRPEQWHVTLRFLGAVEASDLGPLGDALAAGLAGEASAPARLGPATATLGAGALVAPVGGLERLARATTAATAAFGEPVGTGPWIGHVTLARCRRRGGLAGLGGRPVRASWRAASVALVASRTDPAGAVYSTLAELPLRSGTE